MASELSVPVTVKIRVLEEGLDATVDFARMLEGAGASAVAVHGRTVKQNKHLCGASNGAAAAAVNAALEVPVILNGGIETSADALELLRTSGCAAVMSSEALLENPGLFSSQALAAAAAAAAAVGGDSGGRGDASEPAAGTAPRLVAARQLAFAREYLEIAQVLPPVFDRKKDAATPKGHCFKFLHQLFDAHTDCRDRLIRSGTIEGLRCSLVSCMCVRE